MFAYLQVFRANFYELFLLFVVCMRLGQCLPYSLVYLMISLFFFMYHLMFNTCFNRFLSRPQ